MAAIIDGLLCETFVVTTELAQQQCIACSRDAPAVPLGERKRLLGSLPGWAINTEAGTDKLTKTYPVKNFSAAMQLAQAVAKLAEAANHHPELLISWGSVRVTWWTHSINGLHFNDFVLAARCELVYQN